ncbi:MAG: ABC transporter permease [Chitinispirillaceae bacterium]|nr:ABC transporter permease [Chitinispirillaceae bacterium]
MLKHNPTLRYIVVRGGWYLLTFVVAVTLNFILPHMGAGNPVDIIMARVTNVTTTENARAVEEAYLKEFGLVETDNRGNLLHDTDGKPVMTPLWKQFRNYIAMCFKGDLGTSFLNYPKKVSEIIRQALPWTIALQLPTILLGWIIGNVLGVLAAYRRGLFDRVFFPLTLLANAMPFFAFGMLLMFLLAIVVPVFPAMGGYAGNLTPGFSLPFLVSLGYHYVLPFFSIFLILVGGQAIGMRSMCIYELGTDYVKYAQWLGMRENIIIRYMFRNAMLPQLTGLALQIGGMIGGALITEMIFSYPGLGMTLLTAIQGNDYPVIQGCTLLITASVLLTNFVVDILIGLLDPRVKAGGTGGHQ